MVPPFFEGSYPEAVHCPVGIGISHPGGTGGNIAVGRVGIGRCIVFFYRRRG